MPKHPFAVSAKKSLLEAYEKSVFALNIPMTQADRHDIDKYIARCVKILDKY